MGAIKAGLRRIGLMLRRIREFSSGDDLHEAQMNRGDDHEHRANSGPMI